MFCQFPIYDFKNWDTGEKGIDVKDTNVSSGATFCSLRDSANPFFILTNEKLLLQYHQRILVRNLANLLIGCATCWHYGSEGDVGFMDSW